MKLLYVLGPCLGLLLASATASAFPDNVRYGYANCASCHVSPTGGGLLTPYGRGASEEFLSAKSRPGEGGLANGAVTLPEGLLAGGDFRDLLFSRDTNVYKSRGNIPMQAELQGGATYQNVITAVASVGLYDNDVQLQTAYALANLGQHAFFRAGRFFPAFGIYVPDHTVVTRRGLGFNEGQQTFNAEAGVMGEAGEVIVDAILKQGQGEISNEEKGYTVRAASYLGGKSQLGVSYMAVKGTVWERSVPGVFLTTGLGASTYLLAEVDQEVKKPVENGDPATENTRVLSSEKLGWEFTRGLHLLGSYETSVTTKGSYDQRLWAAGPGIQWFPRPHFEVMAQAQRRLDETWSEKPGQLWTLMLHYYL